MAEEFKVRRDSSTNNVPTVGYNEGVDAQDVILFGAGKVTETLVVDATGKTTLTYNPVSLGGETFEDTSGVRRGRNFNDDITIRFGERYYYCGSVNPVDKTIKVYTDSSRTTVLSGGSVSVTYYRRIPLRVNTQGELMVEKDNETKNVNIYGSTVTLPVSIKSSDVQFSEKAKIGVMLKKEGAIAAGASSNVMDLAIGDNTKDMYITNAVAYYNGTDTDTDGYVGFWFDIVDPDGSSVGTMDFFMPPKIKGMLHVDFGPVGLRVPANGKFRFRVGSSWTQNTVHILATGWQYTD